MNKDLISRQDAIKEVSKYVHSVDMIIGNGTLSMADCMDVAEEILEGLPSIESEPKWIPCSERLPKKIGYYLTTNEYKVVHEDYYWGSGCFEKAKKYQCEVVAWMPMPIPPYCGGGGNGE